MWFLLSELEPFLASGQSRGDGKEGRTEERKLEEPDKLAGISEQTTNSVEEGKIKKRRGRSEGCLTDRGR